MDINTDALLRVEWVLINNVDIYSQVNFIIVIQHVILFSVWGECSHCFHIHCIVKWLNSQNVNQQCPMCRQDWKFKE